MSAPLILAVLALVLTIVDVIRPMPYLLNVAVACLAIALIV